METQLRSPSTERRRHPRRLGSAQCEAIVRTEGSVGEFLVHDLSVGGARLLGPPLAPDTLVEVLLRAPGLTPVRVLGRVRRRDGTASAVVFLHRGDDAEDGIQSIVLRDLEQARAAPG